MTLPCKSTNSASQIISLGPKSNISLTLSSVVWTSDRKKMDAADQELKQRASTCAIKVSTVFLKIGRSSCKHFFWLMLMSASLSKPSGGLGTGPWSRCSQPKRWSSSFFIILTMVMQDQNERKQSVSSSQPTAARISRAAFRLQSNSS